MRKALGLSLLIVALSNLLDFLGPRISFLAPYGVSSPDKYFLDTINNPPLVVIEDTTPVRKILFKYKPDSNELRHDPNSPDYDRDAHYEDPQAVEFFKD